MHKSKCWRIKLYNNIYVAVFCVFPTCDRSKNAKFGYAIDTAKLLLKCLENRNAVL